MNIYDIAGLKVGLDCQLRTMKQAEKYLSKEEFTGEPDLIINPTMDEIRTVDVPWWSDQGKAYFYESKIFYQKILNKFAGLMVHSSAVVVDDKAYLFSAPSGTGKSTHTGLWLEYFGDKAYILNDDKPIVRIIDNIVYAFGTPWSGKVDMSANKQVKVQGICFIERSEENSIKPMPAEEAIMNMYRASIHKVNKEDMLKILEVIDNIIKMVPIYKFGCTPTLEAVKLSYEVMSRGVNNEKV